MMRVIDLALKDILQILHDWKSTLFLVVMPVLFTFFFGLVLGEVFTSPAVGDPRLPLGIINQDPGGALSSNLVDLIDASEAVRPVVLEGEEAEQGSRQVEQGELAAVLSIPAGYSDRILAGEEAELAVIADQNTDAGRTAVTALETVTGRLLGAVQAARMSAAAYAEQAGFESEDAHQEYLRQALGQAVTTWRNPPLQVKAEMLTGVAARDDVREPQSNDETELDNPFLQSSPGMIVQFAIFGLTTSAMVLVLERQSGALQRLLTTTIRPAQVIAGHVLAMFLVVFVQEALLIGIGQFAFGLDYSRVPLAVLLMMFALALWVASLGLLVGTLAKGEEQVISLSLIAMFIFSALGGAWFPLEMTGETFATIGHLMPSAWAMDGFQSILVRAQGLEAVLIPAGILLAYTAVFFALAVWRFRFE